MSDTYSLRDYGNMIADAPRLAAYSAAIAQAVRPGDVVLEVGCGPGVVAMLAARAGARRVFAVDTADVIDLARRMASANGLAGRIEFFQCDSRKLTLPERANVVVSDLRGALPFYSDAIASLADARSRHLIPRGKMIPECDTLQVAIVDAGAFYSALTSPWQMTVPSLNLTAAMEILCNEPYSAFFKPEELLTEAQAICILNFTTDVPEKFSAERNFTVTRSGNAHGICVWFDSTIFGKITYSSGPWNPTSVYAQQFFPWPSEVSLQKGQEIRIRIRTDRVGSSYVWQWESWSPAEGRAMENFHFRQSTFHGGHFSPRFLRTHASDFTPELSERGRADLWLLQAMNGNTALQEIARDAAQRFPQVFASESEAMQRAADIAQESSC